MKNFGFRRLILIEPKCDHLEPGAIIRAKHGKDVLKNAVIVKKDFLKTLDYIIGTTSRVGTDYNIPRSPIRPEQLSDCLKRAKGNIAILFGRESIGLKNNEILMCDFIVSIPATKKYSSLNISHAVGIILYELFKKSSKIKHESHFLPATKKEREVIMIYLNKILNSMDFQTQSKKETQKKVWKRIIGKALLTKREAFALIGFLRKLDGLVDKRYPAKNK
jgi:TrmH family RNA methyltransferase